MKTIYSERSWLKDDKQADGSIHTAIEECSRGVTSIPDNPKGEPIMDYTASASFTRGGGVFSSTFIIKDADSKEEAMKSLSIMIEDLTKLRQEVIKLP